MKTYFIRKPKGTLALTSAVLFCLLTSIGPRGRADEGNKQAALQAFKAGVEQFNEEHYAEAVTKFREAHRLNPSWKIQYNIGQCEAALKRYGLALEAFEHYLAKGGDDVPDDRRDEVVNELRRMREMVGAVEVRGPSGIVVFIDDIERGATPLGTGIRVTAGIEHGIRLVKSNEELLSHHVTVGGGQTVTIDAPEVTQKKEEPPAVAATPPPIAPEPEKKEPPAEPAPVVRAPSEEDGTEESGGISPVFFWVGLGATAAFGAGTLAMNFAAENKWDQANKNPADESIQQSGKSMQVTGLVFLGLTGAAAITTAILAAFTDFRGNRENADTDASIGFFGQPNAGGVMFGRRF